MRITLENCSKSCRALNLEEWCGLKVRHSPRGQRFSQYYELYNYTHQCTYLDVRDYTEVNINLCVLIWYSAGTP